MQHLVQKVATTLLYCGYCGIPWNGGREAVPSTLVEVVTRVNEHSGTPGVLPRCEEDEHAILYHTDKPQSMQKPRRRLIPRGDQDS